MAPGWYYLSITAAQSKVAVQSDWIEVLPPSHTSATAAASSHTAAIAHSHQGELGAAPNGAGLDGGGDGEGRAPAAARVSKEGPSVPDVHAAGGDVRRMGGARTGGGGWGGGLLWRGSCEGGDDGPSAPPPMDSWLPAPRAAGKEEGDGVGYIGVSC